MTWRKRDTDENHIVFTQLGIPLPAEIPKNNSTAKEYDILPAAGFDLFFSRNFPHCAFFQSIIPGYDFCFSRGECDGCTVINTRRAAYYDCLLSRLNSIQKLFQVPI